MKEDHFYISQKYLRNTIFNILIYLKVKKVTWRKLEDNYKDSVLAYGSNNPFNYIDISVSLIF